MHYLFGILALTAMTGIAVGDYRQRSVAAYWMLLLWLACGTYAVLISGWEQVFVNFSVNTTIIILLVLMLGLYFKIRKVSFKDLFKHRLGLGDVLFWLAVTPLFSPLNFLIWYAGSMVIVLVLWVLWLATQRRESPQLSIPLAGLQATMLFLLLILNTFLWHVDLARDIFFW